MRTLAMLDTLEELQELDQRLSSGEPLPDQWRWNSDRDVVERWALSEEGRKAKLFLLRVGEKLIPTVKLSDSAQLRFVPLFFSGKTPDEAYHLAAEWVRGQDG